MLTARMHSEKIAQELLAQTRSPQDAYECAIRREKGIEYSRTMKTNPFGNQVTATKQEPIHYINTRVRSTSKRPRKIWRRVYLRGQQNARGQPQQQRNQYSNTQKQCYKCGNQFGQNHLQSCPAKDKICSKSAKRGHSPKCVAQEMLTIWRTVPTKSDKKKPNQRVKEQNSIQSSLLILRQKMVGRSITSIVFQ